MAVDAFAPALIGAIVGAAASLLGGFLAGWRQSKLEEQKWRRGRSDSVRSDRRAAVTSVAKALASTSHQAMWGTYRAITSSEFSEDKLAEYATEYHKSVSELVAAQMLLAALDQALYTRVTPLVSEAIELGGEAYVALRTAIEDASAGAEELQAVNSRALEFIKKVPSELASTLQDA